MDPDYEQYRDEPTQSLITSPIADKTDDTTKRICTVLSNKFSEEIDGLESDIYEVDKRLNETRLILNRMRAAMLISYYDRAEGKPHGSQQGIHPAVKTEIGKSLPMPSAPISFTSSLNENTKRSQLAADNVTKTPKVECKPPQHNVPTKTKHRIVVGNVSKYIPLDCRQRNDQSTHKWMVYVRGARESPDITPIVSRVWFFLHPTYRPNDLVEVTNPPFHLTRRGWGEFPVRVQLQLHDRGRKVDIIHMLKLDRTYTGQQNLGAETHVDIEIEPPLAKCENSLSSSQTIHIKTEPVDVSIAATSQPTDSTIKHPSPQKLKQRHYYQDNSDNVYLQGPTDPSLCKQKAQVEGSDLPVAINMLKEERVQPKQVSNQRNPIMISLSTNQVVQSDLGINNKMKHKTATVVNGFTSKETTMTMTSKPVTHLDSKKFVSILTAKTKFTKSLLHDSNAVALSPISKGTSLLKTLVPESKTASTSKQTSLLIQQPRPAQSLLKPNNGTLVVSKTLTIPVAAPKHNSLMDKKVLEEISSKPSQPFIKCKLPDGRIMLVRKKIVDSQASSSRSSIIAPGSRSSTPKRQLSAADSNASPRLSIHTASTKDALSSLYTYKMPDLQLIPDMQTLVGHLAKLYPLLGTLRNHHSQLCPTLEMYTSWPGGKRRALELQRAKALRSHLLKYTNKPFNKFFGMVPWTTKNIMLWCRRHLFTPCTLPEDRLLSPSPNLSENELASAANKLLEQGVTSSYTTTSDDVVVVSVEPDVADQTGTKEKGKSVGEFDSSAAVPLDKESEYVRRHVAELGISVGDSSPLMYKLYTVFMEDLIRKCYAAKTGCDTTELTQADICSAVKSNVNLSFLNHTFFEEKKQELV